MASAIATNDVEIERVMTYMNERNDLSFPKGDRTISRCERAENPKYGTGIRGSVTWTYYYVVIDGHSKDDSENMRRWYKIPEPYNNTVAFPNDEAGWVPGTHMILW